MSSSALSFSYPLMKYLEMDQVTEVDLFNEIDSLSDSSTKTELTSNRKLVLATVNLFCSIVNFKVEKCRNIKKMEDLVVFLSKLKEAYDEFEVQAKRAEIFHLTKPERSYGAEMLKITRYENDTEKVSKATFKVIGDIMRVLREFIMTRINVLDSVEKIKLSVTWLEIKTIEFLDFIQQ